MEHSNLTDLINALTRNTKVHICAAFFGNYGNSKTIRPYSQMVHGEPACLEAKKTPEGLSGCYRCRRVVVQKAVRYRKSFGGYCARGIYEYCRPVVYEDRVIAVIFIGNILTSDPVQREKLSKFLTPELLDTMERNYTREDCEKTADIVESYITFLFDTYGIEKDDYDPLLDNIKGYLRENLAHDISLQELATVFHYSEKYLGRLFKDRVGHTVKEYCNIIKVEQAKLLLSKTKLSITVIAGQVGFNDVTYFDRVFRKITGISPRLYRTNPKKTQK